MQLAKEQKTTKQQLQQRQSSYYNKDSSYNKAATTTDKQRVNGILEACDSAINAQMHNVTETCMVLMVQRVYMGRYTRGEGRREDTTLCRFVAVLLQSATDFCQICKEKGQRLHDLPQAVWTTDFQLGFQSIRSVPTPSGNSPPHQLICLSSIPLCLPPFSLLISSPSKLIACASIFCVVFFFFFFLL